jgi:hypothetical protein
LVVVVAVVVDDDEDVVVIEISVPYSLHYRMSVEKVYTILHTSTQNTERVKEKLPSVTALTTNLREKVTKVSVLLGSMLVLLFGLFDSLLGLTEQAQQAHDVQTGIVQHVQETSVKHSVAFWIFFCFYQLLFCIVVLFWRLKKADKSRSRFG